MTTLMQDEFNKNSVVDRSQKLRFVSMKDYWAFVAQVTATRIRDFGMIQSASWADL